MDYFHSKITLLDPFVQVAKNLFSILGGRIQVILDFASFVFLPFPHSRLVFESGRERGLVSGSWRKHV